MDDCLDASSEPRVMVFGYGPIIRGSLIGWDERAAMPEIKVDTGNGEERFAVVPIWQVHVFK